MPISSSLNSNNHLSISSKPKSQREDFDNSFSNSFNDKQSKKRMNKEEKKKHFKQNKTSKQKETMMIKDST